MDRRREPLPTRVEDLPALPAAYERALAAGLASLGLVLDAAARAAIAGHVRLLLAWNRAINLTAIVDPERIATLHVVDSLTAVPLVATRRGPPRLLDLGSGGGFPGLPLATAVPGSTVLLVESIGKKARFLEAAVAATDLGTRVAVAAVRAEALAEEVRAGRLAPFDVLTARAVGSLPELVRLAFPLLVPGGRLVAWKRGDMTAEIDAAVRAAAAFGGARVRSRATTAPGLEGHVLIVVEPVKPARLGRTQPAPSGRSSRLA